MCISMTYLTGGYINNYYVVNFPWLMKQLFMILLSVGSFYLICFISGKIGKTLSEDQKLLLAILLCLNWIVFQIFYSSYSIFIPYVFWSIVHLLYFAIFYFIYNRVFSSFGDDDYILKVAKKIHFFYVFLSFFTLIYSIVLIRGNGVPRMTCMLLSSGLVPVSCDLRSARDGVYIYRMDDDLRLMDRVEELGLFLVLSVKNKKIDSCKLFRNKECVGNFQIAVSDGQIKDFCGFNSDGVVIGFGPNDISYDYSFFISILEVIKLLFTDRWW